MSQKFFIKPAASAVTLAACMSFVLSTSAQVLAQTPPPAPKTQGALLEIGVSGKPGANGGHGVSYGTRARPAQSGTGFFMNSFIADFMGTTGDIGALFATNGQSGRDGRSGGAAGQPGAGEHAGTMDVNLSSGNATNTVAGTMFVYAQLFQNTNTLKRDYTVQYGSAGSLYLYAVGGKGGNGGTVTEEYEVPWFTPGGSDGNRGSSGSNGNAHVNPGPDGKDGAVQYVIKKEDGTEFRSSDKFKLSLVDFHFDGMDGNGILEPGETVTVSRVTVKNNGGLPTPAFQKTKIYIAAKEWVMTDGLEIEIPHSLAPGESYTLDRNFTFAIKDTHVATEGARLVSKDRIEPLAHILEVNRHHPDFKLVKDFEITFPVEISEVSGLRSLAPGEKTLVKFNIKNISTKDLGSVSELKRLVQYTLRSLGGNMDVSMVKFKSTTGKEINLKDVGSATAIDTLKAGESFTVEGTLSLDPHAEPFTSHTVRASLGLQHPQAEKSSIITNTQNRDLTISAAQTFRPSEAAGILLVTNSETHIDEAKAWQSLGAKLGLPVDVWDASYYGRLPLLEDMNGRSMAERYKEKTIVILDNDWTTSDSATTRTLRNTDLLKKNEFLKVAASCGINTLIIGSENSAQKILERFYFPTEGESKSFTDVPTFLKTFDTAPADAVGEIGKSFAEVDFGSWQFFGQPRTNKLVRKASKLEAKLSKLSPSDQFVVAYNMTPTVSKTALFGLFKKVHLGTIQVRRTLSRDIGLVASVSGKEDQIHQAKFVMSEENLFSFFTALPAEARANLIARALTDENYAKTLRETDVLDSLVNATLASVAIEQAKASPKTIAEHVKILDLIAGKLEGKTLPAANQEVLVNLLGHLSYFASSQVRWWMYLVPVSSQRKISNFIASKVSPIFNALSLKDTAMKVNLMASLKTKVKELRFTDKKLSDRSKKILKRYSSDFIDGNYLRWDQVKSLGKGRVYTVNDIKTKTEHDNLFLSQQGATEAFLKSERAGLLSGETGNAGGALGAGMCEGLFK